MSEQDKTTMSAEEVLQKFDKESDKRNLTGMWDKLISFICIAFAVFQLYTATFGVLDAHLQRAIHLAFGFSLIYLLYPGRKNWSRSVMHPLDVIFAVLSVASALYIVIFYDELVLRAGMNTEFDFSIAFIGTLLLFEAARRVVGWPMLTVALFFMFYAFAGPYMPGILAHRGVGVQEMFDHLFFTTEGIFGTPLGVSSTFIYLFILFGSYLEATGLGKLFIDLANAVAGWAAGGPAKVAVLSSGLMGTVSGSSVANVAGTGAFTIPMMKKLGYRPAFAGAVEAAASTGGQLMPPVMGAAAFLMAEFVGVPYIEVVKAAVIPALLYYIGVWIGVHYEAKKFGLKGTPRDQLPKFGKLFMEKGHLILPLAIIVYLLVSGYTPMRAALWAIGLTLICSCLRKSTRISFGDVVKGLIEGSKGVLGVLIACATAGVIIGVVTKTGVGLKLATALLDLAGGHLLPAMFFTMITSLILGMGVPTTANYVITYNPHFQRPAYYPVSDGYLPPEEPIIGAARQINAVAQLKKHFENTGMLFIGAGYTCLQEYLTQVGQAAVRAGKTDFVGIGRMVLAYPELPADTLAGCPLNCRRICRTFGDCTTAPRSGMVSGCYPLDEFYKCRPECERVKEVKRKIRES